MKKAYKLMALLMTLCLVFMLAACGGGGSSSAAPAASGDAGASTADAGGDTGGDAGGDMPTKAVVAVSGEILTVDPQVAQGTPAEIPRMAMYEGLVWLNEATGEIEPWLATEWENSEDGLTWTFKLREGVKFHDGSDFTADDVKRTFDRLRNSEYGSNRITDYQPLVETNVIDDYTIEMITDSPQGNWLNMLGYGGSYIIGAEAIEEYKEDLATNAVGTGPYKMKEMQTGEFVLLERNDDYWGDPAQIAEVEFRTVLEESTRVNMLLTGEAQYAMNIPPQEIETIEAEEGLAVRTDPSNRVFHIGFNMNKDYFSEQKVRQAINFAINKEELVASVLAGYGTVTNSFIAPTTWGYYDTGLYSYDPDKARELLAEAGYPDGFSAKLYTPQGRYFRDREMALAVASQLQEVGINLEVEVVDWGTYLDELRVPEADGTNMIEAYVLAWEAVSREGTKFVPMIFSESAIPPNGWNTMFYRSAEIEDLYPKAAAETDDGARLDLMEQMQEIIMEDAPWAPIFTFQQVAGFDARLQGVEVLSTEIPLFNKAYFG